VKAWRYRLTGRRDTVATKEFHNASQRPELSGRDPLRTYLARASPPYRGTRRTFWRARPRASHRPLRVGPNASPMRSSPSP
jgi:hypothetical protein